MLKTLWFIIRLAALALAILWLLAQPGEAVFTWKDYTVETAPGIAVIAAIIGMTIIVWIVQFISFLINLPNAIRRRNLIVHHEKGNLALERAFSALTAGDSDLAEKETHRARKLLGKEHGLTLLAEAMVARQQGNTELAQHCYSQLLAGKNTAFLGLRGLLQLKKAEGDLNEALRYAREAETLYPRQGWIAKALFELEVQAANWTQGLSLIKKLVKLKVKTKDEASSDRAVIYTAQAISSFDDDQMSLLRKALKEDKRLIPAAKLMIKGYIAKGKRSQAVRLFEKTWSSAPHPDLLPLWEALTPDSALANQTKQMLWYEKLVDLNTESTDALCAAAKKAMELKLYSQGRNFLRTAERIQPSAKIYRLFADLEEQELGNMDAANAWLEKAMSAPEFKKWVCTETGLVYNDWSPLAPPHNSFNTMVWDYPANHQKKSGSTSEQLSVSEMMLIPGDVEANPIK